MQLHSLFFALAVLGSAHSSKTLTASFRSIPIALPPLGDPLYLRPKGSYEPKVVHQWPPLHFDRWTPVEYYEPHGYVYHCEDDGQEYVFEPRVTRPVIRHPVQAAPAPETSTVVDDQPTKFHPDALELPVVTAPSEPKGPLFGGPGSPFHQDGLELPLEPTAPIVEAPVNYPVVGSPVGTPVSTPVGAPVGTPEGAPVGTPVGSPVGTPIGAPVGSPVVKPIEHLPIQAFPVLPSTPIYEIPVIVGAPLTPDGPYGVAPVFTTELPTDSTDVSADISEIVIIPVSKHQAMLGNLRGIVGTVTKLPEFLIKNALYYGKNAVMGNDRQFINLGRMFGDLLNRDCETDNLCVDTANSWANYVSAIEEKAASFANTIEQIARPLYEKTFDEDVLETDMVRTIGATLIEKIRAARMMLTAEIETLPNVIDKNEVRRLITVPLEYLEQEMTIKTGAKEAIGQDLVAGGVGMLNNVSGKLEAVTSGFVDGLTRFPKHILSNIRQEIIVIPTNNNGTATVLRETPLFAPFTSTPFLGPVFGNIF